VYFPRVLAPIVGDQLHGTIDIDDGSEIRVALETAWPGIGNHLFDSAGAMRPHVLCFVDGESHRLSDPAPVRDGSEIRIVQAVSGG
jgi:hypothetical protein